MARPLRIEFDGAFYHVLNRGLERRLIFSRKEDYDQFLSRCLEVYRQYGVTLHGYCLMPNHYHLLAETPKSNLGRAMRHLNGSYTQYFNRSRKRIGPLFQGRYKAILVDKDFYLLQVSRYIHLNPVKARLCKHPEEYSHSSYKHFFRTADHPAFLNTKLVLSHLHQDLQTARKAFDAFTREGLEDSFEPEKFKRAGCILGDDNFINSIHKKFLSRRRDNEIPGLRLAGREEGIGSFSYFTLNEIKEKLGLSSYHAVSKTVSRLSEFGKKDRRIKQLIRDLENKMSYV